ncbi:hypothetical protein OJAV_G00198130 [Oryzias javanicus]|uniref:Centrosome and spindle pole-associated protein 1 n=1 Tax=Oryzias javanicus TaxID=123683 RepID=A0A437C8E9_ORYJA|nr:hypothetical protein OJAV_G00198130 [Oryzias javanicus]
MEDQKPLQDLQLDFKCHVAKNHDLKTCEPHPEHQGLSLPMDDRASVKKRLREEMNKEYNQFLQEQAQIRKLNRRVLPVTPKSEKSQPSNVVNSEDHLFSLKTNANTDQDHAASRRYAATLTEDAGERSTGTQVPQSRRKWNIPNTKGLQSSEEGHNTDKEGSFGCQTQEIRISEEPECSELEPNTDKEDQIDFRGRRKQNRSTHICGNDLKVTEACSENSSDQTGQTDKRTPGNTKRHAEFTMASRNVKKEIATGLIIGATEDPAVTQMKKEQYKQELLRQIAEQRDNKLKEKKMEVNFAAIGASDPEKEPGRIKRCGAELEQTDSFERDVPRKPDMEYAEEVLNTNPEGDKPFKDSRQSQSPGKTLSSKLKQLPENVAPLSVMAVPHPLIPPLDYFNEDLNRAFILRFPGVAPPPLAPIVPNTYMTTYDGAHLYYGRGNYPFHPVQNQNGLTSNVEVQNNMNNDISPKKLPPLNANDCTDSPPSSTESLHVDKSPLRRDNAAKYQEALRQQIKERESHKRREKEENEKFQAEMNSFDPWGRGGGGAPIKDQNGNLVSDFYQIHRIIAEKTFTPGAYEAGVHFPGSGDQSSQRQLSIKERLREEQKQEIEERKRRQAEERERMRIIEEKEEQRLAKERAFIKQNYEEEQRKLKNKETIRAIPQIPQEEEVKRKEKQRTRSSTKERGGNTSRVISRGPSPPIPTLQKKQTNPANSRPSSVTPNTFLQEHPVPAAHDRPIPERASLPHNGREEVIRELSALRRLLKTEQKKLEVQMGQTFQHSIQSRRQPTADASEGARKAGAVAQVDKKSQRTQTS